MAEKKRILLADDEPHIRAMLSSLVEEMGCDVAGEAMNGAAAVKLYRDILPDLLLLDINMPIKTGESALRDIMAEFPAARIIMLTSMADLQIVEACLLAGAFNYIRKDCPLAEIRTAISEALT